MRKFIFSVFFTILHIVFINFATAEWSPPCRISQSGNGYYPQIISTNDTIYVLYDNQWFYGKICFIRSVDSGISWSTPLELSDRSISSDPRIPHIIVNNNQLLACWLSYINDSVFHYNIAYRISIDNGESWLPIQYVFINNLQYGFSFAASGHGSVIDIVGSFTAEPDSSFLESILSTNFGQSWNLPRRITRMTQGDLPDQANQNESIHLVRAGRFDMDSSWEVYYFHSSDDGYSWPISYRISQGDLIHSYFPSVCASGLNTVRISWMDFKFSTNISTGDIFFRQSIDNGITWEDESQITSDHYARKSDISTNGDTINICWENLNPERGLGSIFYTKSTDGGQSWDSPYWVDNDPNLSGIPSISSYNGRVFIIWIDAGINGDSSGLYFSRWNPDVGAVIGDAQRQPVRYSLSAYPNPFNSATTITLSGIDNAEIEIYDITGRKIILLPATQGRAIWDASGVSSGIYFARVAGKRAGAIKLVLVK